MFFICVSRYPFWCASVLCRIYWLARLLLKVILYLSLMMTERAKNLCVRGNGDN